MHKWSEVWSYVGQECLCECFAHICVYTQMITCPLYMYDDLDNSGALSMCSQGYPKLDGS